MPCRVLEFPSNPQLTLAVFFDKLTKADLYSFASLLQDIHIWFSVIQRITSDRFLANVISMLDQHHRMNDRFKISRDDAKFSHDELSGALLNHSIKL